MTIIINRPGILSDLDLKINNLGEDLKRRHKDFVKTSLLDIDYEVINSVLDFVREVIVYNQPPMEINEILFTKLDEIFILNNKSIIDENNYYSNKNKKDVLKYIKDSLPDDIREKYNTEIENLLKMLINDLTNVLLEYKHLLTNNLLYLVKVNLSSIFISLQNEDITYEEKG